MGDVVNLQQYRKKLKREGAERRAIGQRAREGQSRNERRRIDNTRRRQERDLDGKRLEWPRDGGDTPPSS